MSSWQEYKKKKKQYAVNAVTSSNSTVKDINSNMSSWQKFKKEKEEKNFKSNTITKNNKDKQKDTIWDEVGNFANGAGKIVDNLWQGMKNGVMSLQQTVGRAANNTQAEFWDLNNQMYKEALEKRLKNNPEETERINNAINTPLISGDKIREESKEYYDKIQKKKDENVLKIQQNTESMNTGVGKYIAGEIAPGIGQMLPGMIGGPIGTTYFIGSASGNYYDDAKQRGMTENQATMYSGVMGIIEGSLEAIGAKLTTNVGKQLLKKNIKGALVNYGLDIGENFLEESIVEPISEIIATTTAGKDKADWSNIGQRMWKSGVAGAITSAITGGTSGMIGSIGSKVSQQNKYKDYNANQKLNKDSQKWLNEADNIIKENNTTNLQDKSTQEQQNESSQQIISIQQENVQNGISKQTLTNYQYQETDNIKINNLRQDMSKYWTDSNETKALGSVIEKIISDKDYNVRLDDSINRNGKFVNAQITTLDNGEVEIKINPNAKNIGEFLLMHETTHAIGTQEMKDLVMDYASKNSEFNLALENLKQEYSTQEVSNEVLADISAQLFGNQEFINSLSIEKPNVFKRIYNKIIELTNKITGNSNEALFIKNLKNKWEDAYRTQYNNLSNEIEYSIGGKQGIDNARKQNPQYAIAEYYYNKALKMAEQNIDNEQIRQETNWFQDKNGDWKFEFSDKDLSLKNIKIEADKTYKLEELLEHDTLFMLYPELRNYKVRFENLGKVSGQFNKFNDTITINSNKLNLKKSKLSIEGTMIHEIQHAIQKIEGFEGGKKASKNKLAYYNSLGEIEAKNTQIRYKKEKKGELNRKDVAPESSKAQPKHNNLDNYIKNRKLLDKIKDSMYNYFNGKGDYNEDFEYFEGKEKQDNQEDSRLVSKRTSNNSGPHGILGNSRNENGEKNTQKIQEVDSKIQSKNEETKKTTYKNEEKNNRKIWNNRINNNIQEAENNSGSFSFDKNTWEEYLEKNYNSQGTKTKLEDILAKKTPTIENEVGNTEKTTLEKNVAKNEEEKANNQKSSFKSLQDKYKLMEIGKRQYEKLLRKEKPTEKEKITVDRLIKGEIENNEIPASVNRQRVVDLYNAKVKFYSVEQEIKAQRKAITKSYRDLAKNMIKNISTWKDKKMGIQYQVNTMKRNLRDIIPVKSEADSLYNEYFKPITKNNATIEKEISKYNDRISKYEINNVESQYIQMIGENKYNPDTKLPLEKIEEFYDKHKSKIDINKCQEAVEEFRNIYDELIVKINDVLIENGYKPIEYRKGYFPHFVENKASTMLGKFAEKLGWKINADTLPTDIAGITDQFKPGKAWTGFSQQRKGDETDYNALKGFDNYIRGAMDVIYHTKDIQKLRALENEIRYQYSEKGIQEQIDNVYDDHESSIEEKQEKINEIYENTKNNPMGFLATELRDYTNNLANKKATADRGLEHSAGRQTYSIMTNIQNRVSANMVGANISSAMTNFIPITQAWSQTSTKNMLRAIKEGVAIQFKDDGFSNESTFLTNRTKQADRLYKTGLDRANDKLGYMFDVVDSFTSNVIVRAKYYDNLDAGMSTYDALDNADEFAKDVIAGRSKGDMPTIFNQKNPLAKLFTAFQLEVNNQYGYMLKDLPADLGDEAKEKLVGAFVKMFLGAFLYNIISEKITGNKSAFSPIDIALDSYNTLSNDDLSTGDKIKTIGTDLVGETPFLGGIAGGGRLPIQGAIPYDDPFSMVLETVSTAANVFDGNEEQKQTAIKSLAKEWSKPLYYVALPFAGGQLKKTIEGTSMYLNYVPGSYTNSGDLRFTVDDDIGSKVKATIFGTYANPYAQDYIDSGFKTISKDNIDEMVGLDMNSSEYRNYKKGLSKSNKTEERLNYINSLDLTDSQKTLAANNINKNSKKTIDMSEYGNYSSYDEYRYARDNPEKYNVVTQITNYDNYIKYKDDIAAIKKKYSTEAGYDSNERKATVQDYINSLDLNQYQKMMLEKMAGGYSIKNYQNYIYEYLEQTDLTSSEKYDIWEELFD